MLTSSSNKLTASQLGAALVVSIAVIGLISEVSLPSVSLGIGFVSFQTWLGCEIYRLMFGRRNVPATELVGVGFALGALLLVVIDQCLVNTAFRDYWWYLVPPVALGMWVRRTRRDPPMRSPVQWLEIAVAASITSSFGLFMLVQERYWPLWIGAALLVFSISLSRLCSTDNREPGWWKLLSILSLLLVVLVTWTVTSWRPPFWWIKTADIQFFEALGYSLAHFGWRDQVFAAGTSMNYHWFSYAWTGMLDRVIDAESWVVITRLAPAISVVVIITLANALARSIGLTSRWLLIGFGFFVALNDFNFESFSMQFSYIWLLAALVLALRGTSEDSIASLALFLLFAVAAFLAKSSNIVVLVALICSLTAVNLVVWPQRRQRWLMFAIAGLGSIGVAYLVVYRGSGYSELAKFGISGYVMDLYGDLDNQSRFIQVVASFLVIANALLPFLISTVISAVWVLKRWRLINLESKAEAGHLFVLLSLIAGLVLTASVLAIFVAPYHEQEEYFLHAFVLLAILPTVRETMSATSSMSKKHLWVVLSSAVLLAGVFVVISPTNEGTTFATVTRIVLGSPILVATLIVGACFFALRRGLPELNIQILPNILITSLIIMSFTANDQWLRKAGHFKKEILASDHEVRYLGEPSVRDAANLVRLHTSERDVIASNYFCEDVQCTPNEYSPRRSDWTKGGEAMTLVVYSERRYLVSGYGFTWQNIEPPAEIRRRIAWSLSPSSEESETFDAVRPRYFLRDTSMPCSCKDLDASSEVARTGRFVLFKLN